MSNDIGRILEKGTDAIKSIILIFWYLFLLAVASVAYTEKAAEVLTEISKTFVEIPFGLVTNYEKDNRVLRTPIDYLENQFTGITPSHILVDTLNSVVPGWEDLGIKRGEEHNQLNQDQIEQYYLLFISVDNYLESLTIKENSDLDGKEFDKSIIPIAYNSLVNQEGVVFPLSVKAWIQDSISENSESHSKTSLVDTFLIIVALGVFGSLIFLTKDLLSEHDENSILSYIFRPIFGMALSIAVFIVAILAHSMMTTAPVQQIRTETMYILGLGAGLLADKAYEYLKSRTSRQFDNESNEEAA